MKVWIVSDGELNTGYESRVRCICSTEERAKQFAEVFSEYNICIKEFEVIE